MDKERKLQIVISAYECSPDHGSEAGLGWNWIMSAVHNSRISKVFVITMERYRNDIEKYIDGNQSEMAKAEFVFVPLPLNSFRKLNQRFKYIIWQRRVGNAAKEICSKNDIAFVHHVTWATCVFPSHLYKAGVPFIYGPVGGGERIPSVVDLQMTRHDRLAESVRKLLADTSMYMPSTRRAFRKAKIIFATTEETRQLIPAKYRSKVSLMQSIGVKEVGMERKYAYKEGFTVLLSARMLYWKGIDIAIEVFKLLADMDDQIKLKIVGAGTRERVERYRSIVSKHSNIEYLGSVSFDEMRALYAEADLLLNCSLHDSGCMVILEALSAGLPVVGIDTGGPHILMDDESCVKIKPDMVDKMAGQICKEIISLKDNPEKLTEMSKNAIVRADAFCFEKKYEAVIDELYNLKEGQVMK